MAGCSSGPIPGIPAAALPTPVRAAATPAPAKLSPTQISLLRGARSRLGDVYAADYFGGGYPPPGKSACVDVLVYACREVGLNLRDEVDKDRSPDYPLRRDNNIDHRWAPNLIVWFRRHANATRDLQAGDFVFWNLTGDGVADHCGVVSNKRGASGQPLVIHQFPPECREEDCLERWKVVGRFRLTARAGKFPK